MEEMGKDILLNTSVKNAIEEDVARKLYNDYLETEKGREAEEGKLTAGETVSWADRVLKGGEDWTGLPVIIPGHAGETLIVHIF
tara:strand:+ start:1221 stop:1472 length:252 start_codon:yes stop_codon:yes gene_type:complete